MSQGSQPGAPDPTVAVQMGLNAAAPLPVVAVRLVRASGQPVYYHECPWTYTDLYRKARVIGVQQAADPVSGGPGLVLIMQAEEG